MNRFVSPDTLIPTYGKIKELAVQVTGSQTGTVAKAKAAYDYLFTNMRYDKTGSGWGRGDAVWACDAKHGNCTDFHSPFIGMLRADGISARFDIGFPLPEDKSKGDIPGYHCWAEFYAPRSAGFRSTYPRHGRRSRRKIISSAPLTPIACSSPAVATLHSHLSRMARPSITSSTHTLRWTARLTRRSRSSLPSRKCRRGKGPPIQKQQRVPARTSCLDPNLAIGGRATRCGLGGSCLRPYAIWLNWR